MIPVLVLIVLNLILYTVCEKVLNKQVENYNGFVARDVSNNIKNITESMQDLYQSVTALPETGGFFSIKNKEDYFFDRDISEYLSAFKNEIYRRNENIRFVYMYIEETDSVVMETGIQSAEAFFKNYVGNNITYEEWKQSVLDNNNFYYSTLKNITLDYDVVAYNVPVDKKSGAVLCMSVEKDAFFGESHSLEWLEKGNMLIYDRYGQLIVAKQDDGKVPQNINEVENIVNKDKIILKNLIKFNTVSYWSVLIAPKTLANKSLLLTRRIFYGMNILALLLVFFVVSYYFRKNFRPIKELADVLDIGEGTLSFSELKRKISQRLDENTAYSKRMKSQSESIRLMQLEKVLRGSSAFKESEYNAVTSELGFLQPLFSVVIFSYNNIADFFAEYEEMSEAEKYRVLLFVIGNIFEELLNTDEIKAYVMETDNRIICVVNHSENDSANVINKLDYGTGVINKEYNFDLSYVMSQAREGCRSLNESYEETGKMNEHKLVFKISGNIHCSKFEIQSDNEFNYYFDSEVEKAFSTYIMSGNYEMAKMVVVSCFENIRLSGFNTGGHIKCLVYDIIAAMIKVVTEADTDIKKIDMSEILEISISYNNMEKICMQILDRLKIICDCILRDANQRTVDISERIKNFVNQNYENVNLSMTYVGEHFDMAPSYLSKKFKEEYNETVPDYIMRLRLEKAKKLIRTHEYTLSAIAEMSGFGNIRTFNRVFKKYEGITPSEYRNVD